MIWYFCGCEFCIFNNTNNGNTEEDINEFGPQNDSDGNNNNKDDDEEASDVSVQNNNNNDSNNDNIMMMLMVLIWNMWIFVQNY